MTLQIYAHIHTQACEQNYSQANTENLIFFSSKHTHTLRNTYNLGKHGEKDPYCELDVIPEEGIQKKNEEGGKKESRKCVHTSCLRH